ncbi:hypothetical protein [Aquimarina aggregata]|uniref:hypothetical protein n=1 Tax=Aquimarina aggregata TaxID=1642818 RepID=UPI00248F55F4|nr:hypothetical protein [Aquimarina aggregata]
MLWKNAKEKLTEEPDALSEREKKYDGVVFIISVDESGEIKEEAIVAYQYIDENGNYFNKMNEFGYDRLPPDVQEVFGTKEDVVGKWIQWSDEQSVLYDAFTYYHRDDSHGYDTWEEYRDAKGLGPKEEIIIPKNQDVDDNDRPRETPSIEQNETLSINK